MLMLAFSVVALGVGALTKTHSALFMFPLCVVIAVDSLVHHRTGARWCGGVIATVAIIMVIDHT